MSFVFLLLCRMMLMRRRIRAFVRFGVLVSSFGVVLLFGVFLWSIVCVLLCLFVVVKICVFIVC